MTPDEIKAKLDALGIPLDQWGQTVSGQMKSPIVERQKELLTSLKGLLEQQIEHDKKKVSELHVLMQRLKHGGGV